MQKPTTCQNGVILALLQCIYLERYLPIDLPIASTALVNEPLVARYEPTFLNEVFPNDAIFDEKNSEERGLGRISLFTHAAFLALEIRREIPKPTVA